MTKNDKKQDGKVEEVENVDSAEQKVLDLENQVKRILADYQNLEKRVAGERRELIMTANKDLLLKILPVLDTLILASKHSTDKTLEVTIQQFLEILKNEGVTRIKTENQEFDPNTMECVTTAEGEEGKVLEELRAGYKLDEKALRTAQVKVGKGK